MTSPQDAPLVAIVTPVYNGARYLAETMDCVQAQTYPNILHIVLDNASTDDTPAIIESFKGRRIPVVSHRNPETLEQVANWEKAIRLQPEGSQYFFVLCADDLMTDDAIERLVTLAVTDNDIGLVGSLLGEGGTPAYPQHVYCKGLPTDRSIFDGRWTIKSYFIHFHEALAPTHMLFRKDYLRRMTPFYNEKYLAFDSDVCLRIMLSCKYGFIHSPIAWRRVHEDSVSTTTVTDEINIREWLEWLDDLGPAVMSPEELRKCRKVHLRHHFRRLLLWRLKQHDMIKYQRHIDFLRSRSVIPGVADYADAIIDWFILALLNRRREIGAVRSLWPQVEADLLAMSKTGLTR